MRVRLTHLVQFSTRAMTRTASRGVSMLAALGAVSLTVLYASPFSITIRSGPGVTFVANRQCGVPLRSSAFTAADFAAAQAGAPAVVVIPIAGTQFTKTSAIEDPLLKVPHARRGNRTRARFPSRSGGNLQEQGY
jgi:hypothetical protein